MVAKQSKNEKGTNGNAQQVGTDIRSGADHQPQRLGCLCRGKRSD
jgi:hypothetical protein